MRGSFAMVSLVLAGCSKASNLPDGWEDAALLLDFSQTACQGTVGEVEERTQEVGVTLRSGSAVVLWSNVVFRCDQAVEAYVRRGTSVDILVQPVDLLPEAPARCDCYYELDFAFNVDDADRRFSFYVRRDEVGGPSRPSLVGSIVIP
jgi:hypothetical protein